MRRFITSLNVQARVVRALIIRDMLSHFGRENLGVFWLMGEPLILTIAVMVMWGLEGGQNRTSVGVVPFALTGYTMVTLWRHLVFRSVHAARENISLMFHRNVHHIDCLMARAFLETSSTALSFITLYTCLYITGFIDPFYDPFRLAGGWLLGGWFSFAVGLCVAGIAIMYPLLEWFVSPIMYITLPLTGLFFMLSWLPDNIANIMAYSPLANCFELFRDGMFGHNVEARWDAFYIIKCNIVLTAIGLLLVRKAQSSLRLE